MNQFNIRVYGVYVENGQLLVTDEIRMGFSMTKLPGGGLHMGEGLAEGLQREWMEELEAEITVGDIFFVNPFLQPSAFRHTDQVIALYFWVKPLTPLRGEFREVAMDFPNQSDDQQIFRWISMDELDAAQFTFPIDKALVPKLQGWWESQKKTA